MNYNEEYEEKYQAMRKAYQKAEKTNDPMDWYQYRSCADAFAILCEEILIDLLKKDEDVLKRLKEDEE